MAEKAEQTSKANDQVRRKIESLRAYYRHVRRKRRNSKGFKTSWLFFKKIDGFLRNAEYNPGPVVTSNAVPQMQIMQAEDVIHVKVEGNTSEADEESSPPGTPPSQPATPVQQSQPSTSCSPDDADLQHLDNQATAHRRQPPIQASPQTTTLTSTGPPLKRRCLSGQDRTNCATADTEDLLVHFIREMESRRQDEGPLARYALTVADRLSQIKSHRRLTTLKFNIDQLIYKAMVEEMTD